MDTTFDEGIIANIRGLLSKVDALLDALEDVEALPDSVLDTLRITEDDLWRLGEISSVCYQIAGD